MANSKSIQILRGSTTYDPLTSEEVLLDGQPFYSKKTKQLYVGEKDSSGNEQAIKDLKPITANLQSGSGKYSTQQHSDPKKNGKLKFPEADLYAKALDPTLTLDSEPIGGQADFSTAFGGNSSAQAKRTIAGGTTTVARGAYSTVFGDNCVTLAAGTDSLAHGYQTVTAAPASHTEGSYTVVMNKKYTEGMFNSQSSGGGSSGGDGGSSEPGTTPTDTLQMDDRRGEAGHADGFNSYVSGFAAHTDGVSNVADGHISKASGRSNRAWSYLSKVDGYQSVVKPDETDVTATGEGSWANGKDIQIVGAKYSYSGGYQGRVSKDANYSFSYGLGLVAQAEAQSVVGQYNTGDDISAFVVGTGTSSSNRKTALRVLKSGQVLIKDAPTNPEAPIRLKDFTDDFLVNSKAELSKRAIQANDFANDGSIKANFDSHLTRIESLEKNTSSISTTIKEQATQINLMQCKVVHEIRVESPVFTSLYISYTRYSDDDRKYHLAQLYSNYGVLGSLEFTPQLNLPSQCPAGTWTLFSPAKQITVGKFKYTINNIETIQAMAGSGIGVYLQMEFKVNYIGDYIGVDKNLLKLDLFAGQNYDDYTNYPNYNSVKFSSSKKIGVVIDRVSSYLEDLDTTWTFRGTQTQNSSTGQTDITCPPVAQKFSLYIRALSWYNSEYGLYE